MLHKNLKHILLSLGVLILLFVFPMNVMATPAMVSVTMDRTSVSQGQSITFSVRTTAQANFVFAMVDGVRVQGTRINTDSSGNHNWQVTVHPTRTTTVVIFANTNNNESGAASFSVPVTVAGTTAGGSGGGTTGGGTGVPPVTGNLAPLQIGSITETPATAAGLVQLTVVTGVDVNETWVEFGNPARFARGVMVDSNPSGRTWVIDFRPTTWAVQNVRVGANRTYTWTGASVETFAVTLSNPFVPPVNPMIQNVTVNPREVMPDSRTTIRITTNANAGAVWVRDIDGREHNARNVAPTTATTRTWEVDIFPSRTGNVTIFANTSRTATGAVQHQENIVVRTHGVHIVDARLTQGAGNTAILTVTTNRFAESVSIINNNNVFPLNPQSHFGTGNRTWTLTFQNPVFPIQIRAHALPNHIGVDAELTLHDFTTGTGGGSVGFGHILDRWIRSGQSNPSASGANTARDVTIFVVTTRDVNNVAVATSIDIESSTFVDVRNRGSNQLEWEIRVRIRPGAQTGLRAMMIQAFDSRGVEVGRDFIDITIVP